MESRISLAIFLAAKNRVKEQYALSQKNNTILQKLSIEEQKAVLLSQVVVEITREINYIMFFNEGLSTMQHQHELKMKEALNPLVKILINIFRLMAIAETTDDTIDMIFISYGQTESTDSVFGLVISLGELADFAARKFVNPDNPAKGCSLDEAIERVGSAFLKILTRSADSPYSLDWLIPRIL